MADLSEELERLGKLHQAGILNEEEFRVAKGKLLHGPPASAPPSSRPLRWEFKEITVPLNIAVKVSSMAVNNQGEAFRQGAKMSSARASQLILASIKREAGDGWQPDEPTDLPSLYSAGRVSARQTGGLLLNWKLEFGGATIRLKRLA